ncbi:sulfurtransferase TusA family protein [Amphritea sp. 1_MG-2023]|uniref:sulfurtransferase TusA family protein n=1 Tax=Amphritea sp. 1_MG-2023 TaxID=3062670 RepID=UPI0026E27ED2|nr:sulfurtransferase TusA family protein [Amphritea sp. 1_MG-2023]MDO6562537.1 sulfurtransferase TusA family protein [Amphritea sp. 1_MG-2023]
MTEPLWDAQLDACGLNCPLPLLKAKQALHKLESGKVLKVVATDAGSQRDFKVFVEQSDHQMLKSFSDGDRYIYIIQRG